MNNDERIYRVIDANLNRLKEGLRVAEDIKRFVFDDADFARAIKILRHKAKIPAYEYLKFRDAACDVLRPSAKPEQIRENLQDVITANFKRAQESARVLEECFKLLNLEYSELFKSVRYELYELEKRL